MNQTSLKNVKALLCFLQVMLFGSNRFQQLIIETMFMSHEINKQISCFHGRNTSQK